MYTQNTPVHVKLWHRDFWLMALAGMFITVAMYIQLPLLPAWLIGQAGFSPFETAVALGVSGIGVFLLGFFCSYWVQRHRRNCVCIWAVLAVVSCLCLLYYLQKSGFSHDKGVFAVSFIRLVQGAAFGLAQMVLSSTLIIDTCESFRRTEANHSSAWFSRMALSLGPALSILALQVYDYGTVTLIAVLLCLLSVFFILLVKFPFKAPEDILCKVSLDRFFLPQGKWLFINLSIITTVVGMLLSVEHSLLFYVMLMGGFFLALLSQRFVFVNADLKSEVITGLILMIMSFLIRFSGNEDAIRYISPVMAGCGIGIIGARFLLFFIKLSRHCQRGTSQSTFFLSWEFGLSFGLFIGYGFFYRNMFRLFTISIAFLCLALIMYVFFTHGWYMRNKNR